MTGINYAIFKNLYTHTHKGSHLCLEQLTTLTAADCEKERERNRALIQIHCLLVVSGVVR